MTPEQVGEFVAEWIDAWNAKDYERVVAHFAEDCQFTSPRAAATVGVATLDGRDMLREYWRRAIGRIETLQFTPDHTVWDAQRQELAIVYTAAINGQTSRACEFMRFGPDGLVVEGEGMYGALLDTPRDEVGDA